MYLQYFIIYYYDITTILLRYYIFNEYCICYNQMSFDLVDKLAKLHDDHTTLTEIEKDLILNTYQAMGDRDAWINWVIYSRKLNKCPYR
jgi:hypothetical protein